MKMMMMMCVRFFRRCWVTFDRSVNIKETCWSLQNVRVRTRTVGAVAMVKGWMCE